MTGETFQDKISQDHRRYQKTGDKTGYQKTAIRHEKPDKANITKPHETPENRSSGRPLRKQPCCQKEAQGQEKED
jgi:hypothetical protein